MALLYDVAFNSQTRALSFSDRAGNNIYSCDIPSKPLTLTALTDNSSVKLKIFGKLNNTFEVNTGNGWSAYTFGDVINLNEGDQCQWRCSSHPDAQGTSKSVRFVMTGSIAASGNCNSMLDGTNFRTMTSIADYPYAFMFLFSPCASLVRPPTLPATTLAPYCYTDMFRGSGIIEAPELPATTLTDHCYAEMFSNVSTLVRACSLPALTLETSCYEFMFKGSGITTPPEMSATSCASGTIRHCLRMFQECPNLTKSPDLKILDLLNQTYQEMFTGSPLVSEVHSAARSATSGSSGSLYKWLDNGVTNGDIYCDPTMNYTKGTSGIPNTWNRWVYGATDTGETTTMYHNGTAETVRVGTSSYGICYSLQGWAGFKTLAEMHALGYTLGEQTAVTMYHWEDAYNTYSCAANENDGFTETMYAISNSWETISEANAAGYFLTPTPNPNA